MRTTLLTKAFTIGLMTVSSLTVGSMFAARSAEAVSLTLNGTGFTEIETVGAGGAGVYGLEARGGNNQLNGDWEVGVGERTSSPGNFNQGQFVWGDGPTPLTDFQLTWLPNVGITTNIGGTVVSWDDSDWQVGDAIRIVTKRQAILNLTEVDGQAVTYNLGNSSNDIFEYYITGNSLLDGWTLTGHIGVTGGLGSKHEVLIKAGNFAQPVPAPAAGLPALIGMGIAITRQKKQNGVSSLNG